MSSITRHVRSGGRVHELVVELAVAEHDPQWEAIASYRVDGAFVNRPEFDTIVAMLTLPESKEAP